MEESIATPCSETDTYFPQSQAVLCARISVNLTLPAKRRMPARAKVTSPKYWCNNVDFLGESVVVVGIKQHSPWSRQHPGKMYRVDAVFAFLFPELDKKSMPCESQNRFDNKWWGSHIRTTDYTELVRDIADAQSLFLLIEEHSDQVLSCVQLDSRVPSSIELSHFSGWVSQVRGILKFRGQVSTPVLAMDGSSPTARHVINMIIASYVSAKGTAVGRLLAMSFREVRIWIISRCLTWRKPRVCSEMSLCPRTYQTGEVEYLVGTRVQTPRRQVCLHVICHT